MAVACVSQSVLWIGIKYISFSENHGKMEKANIVFLETA
jgi:hypothetical protein